MYEYKQNPVEIEVTIVVGGKSAARLLLDELKRRNQESLESSGDSKPKILSEAMLAREMGIDTTTFNNLMTGKAVSARAGKINRIIKYFVGRYGEEGRVMAQRALGVYGE